MRATKIIRTILIITVWLYLIIYFNFTYREGLFVRTKGFPFTWEFMATEGVIYDESGLCHIFNYPKLLINIGILSFIYFGIIYSICKIIALKTLNIVQNLLFSSALSAIYSLRTLEKALPNPYTRKMSYFQFLREAMLPVNKFFYDRFQLPLNITKLMIALHFFLNFLRFSHEPVKPSLTWLSSLTRSDSVASLGYPRQKPCTRPDVTSGLVLG